MHCCIKSASSFFFVILLHLYSMWLYHFVILTCVLFLKTYFLFIYVFGSQLQRHTYRETETYLPVYSLKSCNSQDWARESQQQDKHLSTDTHLHGWKPWCWGVLARTVVALPPFLCSLKMSHYRSVSPWQVDCQVCMLAFSRIVGSWAVALLLGVPSWTEGPPLQLCIPRIKRNALPLS